MAHTDQLAQAHQRIEHAVQAIVTGDQWRQMLHVAARFHTYSPNNIWLILAQNPHATQIAGFHTWRKVRRQVRKGERGIAILAPMVSRARPVTDADTASTAASCAAWTSAMITGSATAASSDTLFGAENVTSYPRTERSTNGRPNATPLHGSTPAITATNASSSNKLFRPKRAAPTPNQRPGGSPAAK